MEALITAILVAVCAVLLLFSKKQSVYDDPALGRLTRGIFRNFQEMYSSLSEFLFSDLLHLFDRQEKPNSQDPSLLNLQSLFPKAGHSLLQLTECVVRNFVEHWFKFVSTKQLGDQLFTFFEPDFR